MSPAFWYSNMKKHQQIIRCRPGADTAILFIHGIIGTPDHFKDFLTFIPENWSICNVLLDGHGKGVSDFSHTSMKKWIRQIDGILEDLRENHDKILICAHSMGTLLAINAAIRNPKKIHRMFLLACPLAIAPKLSVATTSLKVIYERFSPEDLEAVSAAEAYGIEPDRRLWKYLGWIPRYLELFHQIRNTRRHFRELSVPTTVFQSRNDELVSKKSIRLLNDAERYDVGVLEKSGHYRIDPEDRKLLREHFQKFLYQ